VGSIRPFHPEIGAAGKVFWLGGWVMQRSLTTKNSSTRSFAEAGLLLLSGERQKLPAGARSFQVCARRLCGGDSS